MDWKAGRHVLGIILVGGILSLINGCGVGLETVPRLEPVLTVPLSQPLSRLIRQKDCLWGYTTDGWVGRVSFPWYPCQNPGVIFPDVMQFGATPLLSTPPREKGWKDDRWVNLEALVPLARELWILAGDHIYEIDRETGFLIREQKRPPRVRQHFNEAVWVYHSKYRMVCRVGENECYEIAIPPASLGFDVDPPWICYGKARLLKKRGSELAVTCLRLYANRCRPPLRVINHRWRIKREWPFSESRRLRELTGFAVQGDVVWMWQDYLFRKVDLRNGKAKWTIDIGSRPAVPPVYNRRRVMIATVGRLVFGFDFKSAYRKWDTALPSPVIKAVPYPNAHSARMVAFVTINGEGYVLRFDTGEVIWHSKRGTVRDVVVDPPYLIWMMADNTLQVDRVGSIQRPRRRTRPGFGGFGTGPRTRPRVRPIR